MMSVMKIKNGRKIIFIVLVCLALAIAVFSASLIFSGWETIKSLSERAEWTERSLAVVKARLYEEKMSRERFSAMFDAERDANENLSRNLEEQFSKNLALETQVMDISGMVRDISGTVGTLQKLSQTDRELLTKYSKVYFLSENYVPSRLVDIVPAYLLDADSVKKIHAGVEPFLDDMMRAAADADIDLKIVSAYRSFGEQAAIKTGYKVLYGYGANQFSADQGYSEHQLGTTLDFTTEKLDILSVKFDESETYRWLSENAHRFGFVLSYPKGNAYYQYEPWHWRFVGIALATTLHNEEKYFYDLTQREINEYLASVFDR